MLSERRRRPGAFRFLLSRFLYSDAIVTVGAYLTVYMSRLGGFTAADKSLVLGLGVVAAAAGAAIAGPIVSHGGPKRPLLVVLPAFAATLLLMALISDRWAVWVAGACTGASLGVIWSADRVLMLALAPPGMRSRFFALFNLASRGASAIGPLLLWAGPVWLLADASDALSRLNASRIAIGLLSLTAFGGWLLLRGVSLDSVVANGPVLEPSDSRQLSAGCI